MGGRDSAGVFPCFVFTLRNPRLCFPPIDDSISSRLFRFERYDFVGCPSFDGFAFIVLHARNAGPSRRRVKQPNLCGFCLDISPEPNCDPRAHISGTYQSIGRVEEARQ